jgi:hypothetical protein
VLAGAEGADLLGLSCEVGADLGLAVGRGTRELNVGLEEVERVG